GAEGLALHHFYRAMAWLGEELGEKARPASTTKPSGGIDPRPWCQGFYAAMTLNIKRWKRLLDLKNPNHGLLLPILIYCVDKKGRPVLVINHQDDSGKAPWCNAYRMSGHPAVQQALRNHYFELLGLPRLYVSVQA
ncbi:hypothetical protein ACWGTI_31445, partial [Mesorhizobium sp. ArgA1]